MEEKLIEIISSQTGISKNEITPDTSLIELGIDSMSFMSLISMIEVAFDIKINPKEIADIYTVKDIFPLIKHE